MRFPSACVATIAVASIVVVVASTGADASAVAEPFPGTGTTYTSATNSSGLIPSGGTSAAMSTAGDSVNQTFTGTGLTSIDSLKVDFNVDDLLDGSSETVDISINGTKVLSFVVPDDSGVDGVTTISGSLFFAPIIGNGTYDLKMTLVDTIPSGNGSIDFQDGGVFVLNGGDRTVGAPEPVTLSLFAAGLGATIAIRRRRTRKVSPSSN